MEEDCKKDTKQVSCTKKDAFNLLRIIQLSEKDIQAGHYKTSEEVFSDLKTNYRCTKKF